MIQDGRSDPVLPRSTVFHKAVLPEDCQNDP